MALIDVTGLKEQLEMKKVTYDLTNEQLELLLKNTTNELIGYTNLPVNPVNHKVIRRDFTDDMFEVDFYPIKEISSLKIGSLELPSDKYVVDNELGIIYLESKMSGMLVLEYVSQLSDEFVENKINPLLTDMISYTLGNKFSPNGVMTSVKEGDVSVNYDSSTSLGTLIQSRIKDLKSFYSIRIRML